MTDIIVDHDRNGAALVRAVGMEVFALEIEIGDADGFCKFGIVFERSHIAMLSHFEYD